MRNPSTTDSKQHEASRRSFEPAARDTTIQGERLAEILRLADAGLLAGGVLHDLANTLVSLQMHCSDALAQAGAHAPDALVRALDTASESARALRAFGAFVRGIDIEEQTDVRRCVRRARALCAPQVERGRIVVVTDCLRGIRVSMPSSLLQQVLVNLILNAGEAIGERRGAIVIRGGAGRRAAWLDVSDDGPGVPPALQARLFEPFTSGSLRAGHTGLGLYMSRRLLEKHGGALLLARSSGTGTTFRLTLPLAEPCDAGDARGKA